MGEIKSEQSTSEEPEDDPTIRNPLFDLRSRTEVLDYIQTYLFWKTRLANAKALGMELTDVGNPVTEEYVRDLIMEKIVSGNREREATNPEVPDAPKVPSVRPKTKSDPIPMSGSRR